MEIIDLRQSLPWHPTQRWEGRKMDQVTTMIVHHSATGENAEPIRTVKAFNRGHIARGWPRIGYHWVIDSAGKVYRTNRNRDITYHAGNYSINRVAIGVCLIGKLHLHDPTTAQLESLKALRQLHDLAAVPHNAIVSTTCPGGWWERYSEWVNEDVPIPRPEPPSDKSKLTLHCQIGLPPWVKEFIRNSGVRWMKMMDPGDEPPLAGDFPDLRWVIRFYDPDPNVAKAEVLQGVNGAHARFRRIYPQLVKRPWLAEERYLLESMNEPSNEGILRTDQGRIALNAHEAEFSRICREELGIRVCGYCLGVGHPEPEHVGQLFRNGLPALKRNGGAWALHEYGYPTVLSGNGWHTLRYRRTVAALAAVGLPPQALPKLHLTEVGIDRLLEGVVGGWLDVNNDPINYLLQLASYDAQLKMDSIVEAAYIYTATPENTWRSYAVTEPLAERLAHYIATGQIQ